MSSECGYLFLASGYRADHFARRLIGRRFDDPTVKKDTDTWPFKVIDDGNGSPKVEVEYLGERKSFSPQEISSMVLIKVRSPDTSSLNITDTPPDEGDCRDQARHEG